MNPYNLLLDAWPALKILSTMNTACTRAKSAGVLALNCSLVIFTSVLPALGQAPSGGFSTTAAPGQGISSSGSSDNASPSPANYGTTTQSPFLGSVPEGKATGTVLPLS